MNEELQQSTPLLPEGGVPNGRGGRKRMVRPILLYNIKIGVTKAAYFSYHLPLWGLLLPEGGELTFHSSDTQFFILNSSFFISGLRPDKLSFILRRIKHLTYSVDMFS